MAWVRPHCCGDTLDLDWTASISLVHFFFFSLRHLTGTLTDGPTRRWPSVKAARTIATARTSFARGGIASFTYGLSLSALDHFPGQSQGRCGGHGEWSGCVGSREWVPVDSSGDTQYCVERESIWLVFFSHCLSGRSLSGGHGVAEGMGGVSRRSFVWLVSRRNTTRIRLRGILLLNGALVKLAVKFGSACAPRTFVCLSHDMMLWTVLSRRNRNLPIPLPAEAFQVCHPRVSAKRHVTGGV
jgi:hypothetical protein